jgi:hypothetical protein
MPGVELPEYGQWRDYYGVIVYVVGRTRDGKGWVVEHSSGNVSVYQDVEYWTLLPNCTGFDWQPPEPETFPQYWTTVDGPREPAAFVRRDSTVNMTIFYKNGSQSSQFDWHSGEDRKRLTESEAMALLQKPVESPDDWVTQDRVPFREGIDQRRWIDKHGNVVNRFNWTNDVCSSLSGCSHGYISSHQQRLEIRCRRKDLPLLTEVLPQSIQSYTTVNDSDTLQKGDLLVDGGLCFEVPPAYFGQIARDTRITGHKDVFFLRDKFPDPPKPEPVDPMLVLETLANMRDQLAGVCKRLEKLERIAEPF